MDCENFCEIMKIFFLIALLVGVVTFFLFAGVSIGKESIMEKCDKTGEFKVQNYSYECKLKED